VLLHLLSGDWQWLRRQLDVGQRGIDRLQVMGWRNLLRLQLGLLAQLAAGRGNDDGRGLPWLMLLSLAVWGARYENGSHKLGP
jgi:hypothetical protein